MSVRSKLQNTFSPLLLELDSIYRKLSPTGGTLVAPGSPVGLFVFVDFIKFYNLPLLFLSLHFIRQFCNRYLAVFGALIIVVSLNCILSYLVRIWYHFQRILRDNLLMFD